MAFKVQGINSKILKELGLPRTRLLLIFKNIWKEVRKLPEFSEVQAELGFKIASVNLLLCDDELMREYQWRFKKLNRTTDVLSFPARESLRIDAYEAEECLGELVVSVPAIVRGAQRRGSRLVVDELTEVLVHGVLHLLGHEHVKGGVPAKKMRDTQRTVFRRVRAKSISSAKIK